MKLTHCGHYTPRLFTNGVPNALPPTPPEVERPVVLSSGGGPRVAILLPSRGQVFSRCMESVLREASDFAAKGFTVAIFQTHNLPIPDCFTQLVSRALKWGADATWLVEEDNYMPEGVLSALWDLNMPVAACDYYNHKGTGWVVARTIGSISFYAFGCTLVRRDVWEIIGHPYCFLGKGIKYNGTADPTESDEHWFTYGGQDIDFSFRLHKLAIPGTRLDGTVWRAGHMHITKEGHKKHNSGCSTIVMN